MTTNEHIDNSMQHLYDSIPLSPAERPVVNGLLKGASNDHIAEQIGISSKTVKFHLTRIFRRMGLKSRQELLVHFLTHKIELLNKRIVDLESMEVKMDKKKTPVLGVLEPETQPETPQPVEAPPETETTETQEGKTV